MPRYAAIDIGSNSVRMLAADVTPEGVRILAQERKVTRLGSSVFRHGLISEEAIQFLCQSLSGMAQTYQKLVVVGVRAVATSAVRDASNQREFIQRVSAALGAPVEIISGQEEARLIHLGVQSRWPHPRQRILVVDVGGGSAEMILSENGQMQEAFSKPLGAVRLTEVFVKTDPPTAQELHRLDKFIAEKITPPLRRLGGRPYARVIATSASAAAIVCAVNRIPRARRDEADRLRATTSQIRRFYEDLTQRTLASRSKLTGIGPRRSEIIIAGAAVFLRILEAFQHHSLYYSAAGVRDGIIADLAARGVGRELSQLSREQRQIVEQMARRYGVSAKHARTVASFAHTLFDTLHSLHGLPPLLGKLLEAAAYLHDIGHYVSDTGHHKHSGYLVSNSEMPGFTDRERHLIAMLCRYHRKTLPSIRHPQFQSLDADAQRALAMLTPLLRLADGLDRSQDQRVDSIDCQLRNGGLVVFLHSAMDIDLELWAAAETAGAFREVFDLQLSAVRAKATAN